MKYVLFFYNRFERNTAADQGEARKRVLPTPVSETYDDSRRVDITTGDWVVVYNSAQVKPEAEYLAGNLSNLQSTWVNVIIAAFFNMLCNHCFSG